MKKNLSLFLAAMLLVSAMSLIVFAENSASMTIVGANGDVGETISLQVKLNTSAKIDTIGMNDFEYDETVLEFVDFGEHEAISDKCMFEVFTTDPELFVGLGLKETLMFDSTNEDICTLKFKVLKLQQTQVSFTPVIKDDTVVFDATITPAEVNSSAGVVDVTSIELDKTTASINVGDTLALKATVLPDDASDKTLTWSSDKESVAKVDSKGKVTAVKAGTAVITAKAGDKTAECTVTVKTKNQSSSGGGSSAPSGGNSSGAVVLGPSTGNTSKPDDKTETNIKETVQFSDIVGRWSEMEIIKANDRGLANGRSEGIFDPAGHLTRHESNKLHMNIVDAVKAELTYDSSKVVDTSADHWAYKSDIWAVAVGISNGTDVLDDGTIVMSGANNITRQDYMTSIYRMMKLVLGDIQTDGNSIEFADSADIAGYAKEAISFLSSLDIVKGSETAAGLTVSPMAQITREEAVAILNRVYDAILALN